MVKASEVRQRGQEEQGPPVPWKASYRAAKDATGSGGSTKAPGDRVGGGEGKVGWLEVFRTQKPQEE